MSQSEILAQTIRSGVVETEHRGHIVIMKNGKIEFSLGSAEVVVPMRSTAKPFQILPFVALGGLEKYSLSDEELALLVSSHNGERKHVETLRSIMSRANIKETLLNCGRHLPFSIDVADSIMTENSNILPIHCNCSGKHVAMLLLCELMKVKNENYWDEEHIIQKVILNSVSENVEVSKEEIRLLVDGCGVPTFGVPLYKLAHAYSKMSKLVNKDFPTPLARVSNAIKKYPFMVGGTNRAETAIMESVNVLAKPGADGLFCMAIPELEMGVAIKIESGSEPISEVVGVAVLSELKCLSSEALLRLDAFVNRRLFSYTNEVVGEYHPVFSF